MILICTEKFAQSYFKNVLKYYCTHLRIKIYNNDHDLLRAFEKEVVCSKDILHAYYDNDNIIRCYAIFSKSLKSWVKVCFDRYTCRKEIICLVRQFTIADFKDFLEPFPDYVHYNGNVTLNRFNRMYPRYANYR